MAFPSVYEMTNPLTTVRKQHFWEYFSGADITQTTTKTYNQADTSRGSTRSLYSNPNVSNGEGERVAVRVDAGHSAIGTSVNKVEVHIARRGTLSGNYEVTIRDGSDTILASASATANNVSTSYSTVELTLDNTVTMVAGYRVCIEYDSTARTANGLDFGTSSSAWESNITQQLYSTAGGWINDPDGSGAGRKFMFTFDSSPATSVFPPTRWTTSNITHTGTYSMVDGVDEGFSILSSTNGARSAIGFNNIRQFSPTASVAIFDLKRMTDASHDSYAGFKFDDTNSTFLNTAVVSQASYATNIGLYTGDGSTATNLEGTTPRDTAWHNYKIENGTDDIKLSIDGVVDVTKTTNRPETSTKLQPFVLNSTNTSASKETRIKYFEAYNT